MFSMTGFGTTRLETEISILEVSVRSVNGRFLESRVHLPRELFFIENDLKKELAQFFQRGTVDVFVTRKAEGQKSNLKMIVHEDIAQNWLKASQQLNKKLKLKGKLDTITLLQLPDVIHFEESQEGIMNDAKTVKKLFKKACQSCLAERKREGLALRKELQSILDTLKNILAEMVTFREEANASLKERFEARVLSRWKDLQLDQQRLYQEVVMQLEKSDIQEELTRLTEHFKHFEELFESEESQGKKLDFYTQELLREVNTIGSKSQITSLTRLVVMAKTNIDKLREQVQNIE